MTRIFSFTLLSSFLALAGAGCGNSTTATDAGGTGDAGGDAAVSDTGTGDAGTDDAGTSDAGTSDAGTSDAGDVDAGASDAGASDAAANDGGGSGPAASCVASGGTVGMQLCCGATPDFPNTCSIGACGCAPSSSHQVMVCNCPSGMCFDGSSCH